MATLKKRIEMLEKSAGADAHRICVLHAGDPVPPGVWAKVVRVEFVESPNSNRPAFETEADHAKS